MITAKIVKYYNDYNQKAFDKTFENLDELADWIFDQMQLDYTKKPGKISVQKRCRSGSRNARSERNIQNSILWRCRQWIL